MFVEPVVCFSGMVLRIAWILRGIQYFAGSVWKQRVRDDGLVEVFLSGALRRWEVKVFRCMSDILL